MKLFAEKSRVLVPLGLPDPEEIPKLMMELLSGTEVVLVGWYEVPEQTPPEQAREEVDDTGEEALESVAERFRDAGAEVRTRHVFTPDLVATVQRVGAEEECDAALISGPLHSLDRMLLVLRESVSARTASDLLADLQEGGPERMTLLQISEEEADEGRDWSDRVLERLEDRGMDTDRIETRVETADDPGERVLKICRDEDFDVVLIPEQGDLDEGMFGSFAERVGREADVPVLVVRVRSEET